MVRLLTLSGSKMDAINPFDLDDQSAGIYALHVLTTIYPGITWGEIMKRAAGGPVLGGWLTDLKKAVGGTISDIGDKLGEWGGSAVRLITDEKVADGLTRYGTAYATSGGSEALKSLLGPSLGPKVSDFLTALGSGFKGNLASSQLIPGIQNKWLMIGGAGLIGVVLLVKMVR